MTHWVRTNPQHQKNSQLQSNLSNLPQSPSICNDNAVLSNNPSNLNLQPRLSFIPSQTRLARESLLSQQKRVRLRDYLFTARSSLQKNRELKKDLKSKIGQKQQLKASIDKLKKNKYSISNQDMQRIVKKEIETQLVKAIDILKEDLAFMQSQQMQHVSNDDLAYFYQIRKIVMEKIRPSIEEMKDARLIRQKTLIQHLFSMGKELVQSKSISRANNKQSQDLMSTNEISNRLRSQSPQSKAGSSNPEKGGGLDLIESIFMGKTKKS